MPFAASPASSPQAAADTYGVRLVVVTSYEHSPVITLEPEQKKSGRTLFLSFWAEVHYNSLYPAKVGASAGRRGPRGGGGLRGVSGRCAVHVGRGSRPCGKPSSGDVLGGSRKVVCAVGCLRVERASFPKRHVLHVTWSLTLAAAHVLMVSQEPPAPLPRPSAPAAAVTATSKRASGNGGGKDGGKPHKVLGSRKLGQLFNV